MKVNPRKKLRANGIKQLNLISFPFERKRKNEKLGCEKSKTLIEFE